MRDMKFHEEEHSANATVICAACAWWPGYAGLAEWWRNA